MTTVASQITSLTIVYSIVYSGADQRKHQSSASLAFVRGIHRDRWIPRTRGQLRGKCFHLMTSSSFTASTSWHHRRTLWRVRMRSHVLHRFRSFQPFHAAFGGKNEYVSEWAFTECWCRQKCKSGLDFNLRFGWGLVFVFLFIYLFIYLFLHIHRLNTLPTKVYIFEKKGIFQ